MSRKHLVNNLLYIFTTNGYKLRLQSFDINSKKIITDNIPDSSGQMIDNVLIKKNKFYVISSSILNYNPVPTIFEFNEDQTIASKNMLIADSSFETRSALFINDSIMLLAGTKYYIGKWNSYSRPSILITTTRGRILKQIDCLYHEYVSNNTGEFIDIKLYKNHFLLLFQSAKLNSNTWKIDWLYELYRASGRSCNSIYINEKDEIVVFGGEFEGNADIPQYDHPKLIKFKILE